MNSQDVITGVETRLFSIGAFNYTWNEAYRRGFRDARFSVPAIRYTQEFINFNDKFLSLLMYRQGHLMVAVGSPCIHTVQHEREKDCDLR